MEEAERSRPPLDTDRVRWIAEQILPYEKDVRAWMRRSDLGRRDDGDAIQEAYCKIAALPDHRHIASGRSYLFTVVRNILLQQVRRDRIVRIDTVAELDMATVVDQAPCQERSLAARERLALVERLIADLPEDCARAFRMRKFENLSQREIATRLGINEGRVERLLARALERVIERLDNLEADTVRPPTAGFQRAGMALIEQRKR